MRVTEFHRIVIPIFKIIYNEFNSTMRRLIILLLIFTIPTLVTQAQQEGDERYNDDEVMLEVLADSAVDSTYLYVVNEVYYIHHLNPGIVLQSIDQGSIEMIAAYNPKDSKELFATYAEKTGKYASVIKGVIVLETRNSKKPSALETKSPSSSLSGKNKSP